MKLHSDEIIRSIAATQHGVVCRRQLHQAGVDADAIASRVKRKLLVALSARVLQLGGSPTTDRSTLMAGMLDAGPHAAVSHQSAAAIWGLPGFAMLPVEVTGNRARVSHGRHPLAVVHQPRSLQAEHCVEIDGLRVTTPTRTLFDLAGSPLIHPKRLERLLDTCWARGLVDHRSLSTMLGRLQRRGRPGVALMRELIKARGADYRPPESNAEARFQDLARGAGFTDFERQVDLGSEDRWIGRVDFVDRERRLVVEVDSPLYHGSLTDRTHDEVRHAALSDAGWIVESVNEADLFHAPEKLLERLRTLRWRAAS